MSRTQTQLRNLTAREVGLDIFRTGTFDGSGGTTTTQGVAAHKVFPDNKPIGAWIYPTDGADAGTDFQVTDFVNSTGVYTFRPAASAALDGDAFELLPFRATIFHNAINDAIVDLSARHILERVFWTRGVVSGSPAYNADFGYFTSTNVPDGYTVTAGTPTLDRTTFPGPSDHCMKLVTSSTIDVDTAHARYFLDYYDETLTMYCWVWADTATVARIAITLDGSTTFSSYHSGDSAPELLSVEVSVGTTLNTFVPQFKTEAAGAAFFSDWWVENGQLSRRGIEHPWPYSLAPGGPDEIWELIHDEANATNPLVRHQPRRDMHPVDFNYSVDEATATTTQAWLTDLSVPQGHRLLIKTRGPLTQPSSDTGVTEVDERQATLIAKTAAVRLLTDYRNRVNPTMAQEVTDRIGRIQGQINRLEFDVGTNDYAADLPWRW